MGFELPADYVDVAERIREFRAKHPHGYLAPLNPAQPFQVVDINGKVFIAVVSAAYREPADTAPGVGMAWEPFPGTTPYTRNSELMNAETSAWGRAIIAVGAADAKRIASAEEVRNRAEEGDATRGSGWQAPASPATRKAARSKGPLPDDQWTGPPADTPQETAPGSSNLDQQRQIAIRTSERKLTTRPEKLAFVNEILAEWWPGRVVESTKELSFTEAQKVLEVCNR